MDARVYMGTERAEPCGDLFKGMPSLSCTPFLGAHADGISVILVGHSPIHTPPLTVMLDCTGVEKARPVQEGVRARRAV